MHGHTMLPWAIALTVVALVVLARELPQDPSEAGIGPPTWIDVWTSIVWWARVIVYGPDQPRPTPTPRRVVVIGRPVMLLAATLIGLGGVAGGAGMAFGEVTGISAHGVGHSHVDGDTARMERTHRAAALPPG